MAFCLQASQSTQDFASGVPEKFVLRGGSKSSVLHR